MALPPANVDSLLLDDRKGSIYWPNPRIGSNILKYWGEAEQKEAWKPKPKKSERYQIEIKDLISSTPKIKHTKAKVVQKDILHAYTKQELFKEICSFKTLVNNWDGYGATPLEAESAANAIFIISCLEDKVIEAITDIFPNPHGTISVIWYNENESTLSLEIGNHEIAYYIAVPNRKTEFFNNIEINDSELSKLAVRVKKII